MAKANPIAETRMASEIPMSAVLSRTELGPPRTLWGDAWRRFRKHKLAMIGSILLIFFIFTALVGPIVYTTSPSKLNFKIKMEGPSLQHLFGVDDSGRDILARVLFGGRISLSVGVVAMAILIGVGTIVGAVAGFFGGMMDTVLMRITDMFLALPQLPLLLLLTYLFRDPLNKFLGQLGLGPQTGIFILIVGVIGILNWMGTARIVRASFLSLKQKEFVEAANCLGVSRSSIMFRHILPNVLSPIIVSATLAVGDAIILESVLSFLGLGFPPNTPTWGRLLFDGQEFLPLAPHIVIWPGLMIFLTVLSINYMGDGLRDALDPRSRL